MWTISKKRQLGVNSDHNGNTSAFAFVRKHGKMMPLSVLRSLGHHDVFSWVGNSYLNNSVPYSKCPSERHENLLNKRFVFYKYFHVIMTSRLTKSCFNTYYILLPLIIPLPGFKCQNSLWLIGLINRSWFFSLQRKFIFWEEIRNADHHPWGFIYKIYTKKWKLHFV